MSHNAVSFWRRQVLQFRRYLITGILTAIPLWITWVIFSFVLQLLSEVGKPVALAAAALLDDLAPGLDTLLWAAWFQFALAVVLTLVALYLLGWATNQVVGRKVLQLIEDVLERIPLIQQVYSATKQLMIALRSKPEGAQRVVLIEFPNREMKTIGLVTRVMRDQRTGQELAAVYVPTTPNPTSGYLEIVPVHRLVETDWSIDDAMQFIISGGTLAPGDISFDRPAEPALQPVNETEPNQAPKAP